MDGKFEYYPKGVCSQKVSFEIKNGKVSGVKFVGGCDGNLKAVAALIEGAEIEEVISRLSGIECGAKPTSCPDQLSRALKDALKSAEL